MWLGACDGCCEGCAVGPTDPAGCVLPPDGTDGVTCGLSGFGVSVTVTVRGRLWTTSPVKIKDIASASVTVKMAAMMPVAMIHSHGNGRAGSFGLLVVRLRDDIDHKSCVRSDGCYQPC